jgi:hypothetical protein
MSSDLSELENYDCDADEYRRIRGTADWVAVTSIDEGGGYDWTELRAYYSPIARRYFWHGGSGCSCTCWGDGLRSADDFENGDRSALIRALRAFADDNEHSVSASSALDATSAAQTFKEPK